MNTLTAFSEAPRGPIDIEVSNLTMYAAFKTDLFKVMNTTYTSIQLFHKSNHPDDKHLYIALCFDEVTEDYIVVGLWNASQRIIRDIKFTSERSEALEFINSFYMDCYEEYIEDYYSRKEEFNKRALALA